MPAIRAQSVEIIDSAHGVLTLVTQSFGTIAVDILRGGSGANTTITFTVSVDGVQVRQQTLANPTIAQAEDWVSQDVSARAGAALQFKVHFYSVNPTLSCSIGCFDAGAVVLPTWWQ